MIDKVLDNKFLGKMISAGQAEGLHYIREEMGAVLSVQETDSSTSETPSVSKDFEIAISSATSESDSIVVDTPASPSISPVLASDANEVPSMDVPSPMERLAEMYASGHKYSVEQICSSLHGAGIDVVDNSIIRLMFTYFGSKSNYDDNTHLSLEDLIAFLSDEVAVNEDYAALLDDSTRILVASLREKVDEGVKMLRKEDWSMAAIVTEYPLESDETFEFIEKVNDYCNKSMGEGNHYLIGESVMYKEMKDGFRKELLFLTLLTIISIFLIVAFTFKSALIPAILVMTVMTGVNMNVFFSGVGGRTMLYLAYLIVQSILMGATIDYGILFTNYYLELRRSGLNVQNSLKDAYKGSIHTIMTSGLIIILAPFIMSELLTEPTICTILSSLTFGALCAISQILLVLPALLAFFDKLIVHKTSRKQR